MTTTAWAHLPNAKHIDRILASLAAHPEKWEAAWTETQTATYIEAWDAAYIAGRGPERIAARNAVWTKTRTVARGAGGGAITALIAWDDCAYMLELPEDALKLLRAVGNEQALLLSAAANILKETSC